MNGGHDIPIDDLITISKKLVDSIFITQDVHSLLALSFITISTHSYRTKRLHTNIKIELAIIYIPDLIQYLIIDEIITAEMGKQLNEECIQKQEELSIILRNYICVSRAFKNKINTKPSNTKTNCSVS